MSGSKAYATEEAIIRVTKDCTQSLQSLMKEKAQNGLQALCGKLISLLHELGSPKEIIDLSRKNVEAQAKVLGSQVDFALNEWMLKTNEILKQHHFPSGETNKQVNLSIVAGSDANKRSALFKGIGGSLKGLSWGLGAIQEVSPETKLSAEAPQKGSIRKENGKDKTSLETKLPSYRERQIAIKLAINASRDGQLKLNEIDTRVCKLLEGFKDLSQNKRRNALSCVLSHFNGTIFQKVPIMFGSKIHYWRVIHLQAGIQGGRRVRPIR